jgi:hypothetical protein
MLTKIPELIEYKIINLSEIKTKTQIKKIAEEIKNEPVELLGTNTLASVFNLFITIAPIADEIIYREKKDADGQLIFSRLFDDDIIRPTDVKPISFWAEEDLLFFQTMQRQDRTTEIILDLKFLWDKATYQTIEDPLKKFLQYLYCISQKKETVEIKGEIPLLPALIALNWFRFFAKDIFYKTTKLK